MPGRSPATILRARRAFARPEPRAAFQNTRLDAYAQPFGSSWLGEHLDSLVIQTLATRAYRSANRLLLGQARRVRGVSRHQLDSVEGKTNTGGIRWCVSPRRVERTQARGAAGSA